MRKTLALALAALLVACFVSYSFAYEFEMKGEYEWRFRWYERLGNLDLFGNAAAQNAGIGAPVPVGFAGPNIYTQQTLPSAATALGAAALAPVPGAIASFPMPSNSGGNNGGNLWNRTVQPALVGGNGLFAGAVGGLATLDAVGGGTGLTWGHWAAQTYLTRGGYSRTDNNAFYNDSRITLIPTFRVNPAIRVHGTYNIGGMRNRFAQHAGGIGIPPFERYSQQRTSINGDDTSAIGSWEQFRLTANIPWGTISVGNKDFPLALNATVGYKARADAFVLVVPYGPFRMLGSYWMARNRAVEGWSTIPDGGLKNSTLWSFVLTYDDGPLNITLANIHNIFHGQALAAGSGNRDDALQIYIAAFKYFNGRFFANAEYSWMTLDRTLPGGATPTYAEGYHLFSELGSVVGPMKVSLMYALASGPVQNNQNVARTVTGGSIPGATYAALISAPGFNPIAAPVNPYGAGANPKVYVNYPINYEAMEPYEFLMFNTYAGGNMGGWNTLDINFVKDEHGSMTDAYCFAGRTDYAVASNLNIWASYIWAHRLERSGTYFGQYMSSGQFAIPTQAVSGSGLTPFLVNAGRIGGSPYVENGYIGWEANGGVDWKLLEGLTFKGRYSYWAPGDFFREAYQAVVLTAGGGFNLFGVQNSRDPIQAFQGSLLVEF